LEIKKIFKRNSLSSGGNLSPVIKQAAAQLAPTKEKESDLSTILSKIFLES
jgi:hypothetical protein